MSGIEIGVAVISAVAALIAAYKDGDKIVARIKKRRAKRGAIAPSTELEKALKDGETDITRLRDEGANIRIDDKAALALKDLIIEVQGTLLHQLAEAEQDDNFNDFSSVTNSAIRTRRKAVNLLNDLYTRAEEEEQKTRTIEAEKQRTLTQLTTEEDEHKPRRFWSRKTSKDSPKKTIDSSKSKEAHPPTPSTEPSSPSKRSSGIPGSPSLTRNSTLVASPTRQSTAAWSIGSRRSTFSMISPPLSPEQLHPLTKHNNYGGFCKGAWYAQNLELKKSVELSVRDLSRAFHCTKCKYSLPADTRDKQPHFDDRVYKLDDMLFRLLFLLKSHTQQKSSRDLRAYGCIFCALAGGTPKRFTGEGHFMEHISRHKSEIYGDVQLGGAISVSAENIKHDSRATYDVFFEGEEDFTLPPSALDVEAEPETPLSLPEDLFGNVWAEDRAGNG